MVSKGKRTFWLSAKPTLAQREKADLLSQNGFDVTMFKSLAEIVAAIGENRPICIIVDSTSSQAVQKLAQMPELNGVRFILSTIGAAPAVSRDAIAENFRDIIPIGLHASEWLHRIQYATSPKPIEFSHPQFEISMNQIAAVFAPARVVWISETHIRIECRGRQNIGAALQISGPIAEAFGVNYLSLTVESIHKEHLYYRFSQALVCRWRIAGQNQDRATSIIRRMHADNPFIRFRSYIAVAKPDARKTLVKELNRDRFEVKVALQRSTMADEISYFSPDILFLDERILNSLAELDLQLLLSKLPPATPIVLIGIQLDEKDIARLFGGYKVYCEPNLLTDRVRNAIQIYKLTAQPNLSPATGKMVQLPPENPWSKIELHVPARLTSLNPYVGTLSLPYSLGTYTGARLETPTLRKALGRDPFIKLTTATETAQTSQSSQFLHHMRFYLSDVDTKEQNHLSAVLIAMVSDYYAEQFSAPQEAAIADKQAAVSATSLAIEGNLAIKIPPTGLASITTPATVPEKPASPSVIEKDYSQAHVISKTARIDRKAKPVDWTLLKAIFVFIMATIVAAALVYKAMNIDSSYYKDNGREYSDFFRRMTDPKFRKDNPVPQR